MLLEMNVKLRRGQFDLATHLAVGDQHVGLLGQSGSGKTTLLSLIAGTMQPQSGYIVLDNKVVYDSSKGIFIPREQRQVGAVLQYDTLAGNETVREHLSAIYEPVLKPRRLFTLDFLGMLLELGAVLDQSMAQLNESERQRVALTAALLKSPRLLLLDDTFVAIGQNYRGSLLPILKHLQTEYGLQVLYASQSLSDILDLTDQLIILDQGRVLRSGSLAEVARQNQFLRYLGLRQIDNVLPITLNEHDAELGSTLGSSADLQLRLPYRPNYRLGKTYQVSIRANDVALSNQFIEGISIQNQLKGRICSLIPGAGSVIVQIDCGHTLLAEITTGACRDLGLQEGQTIFCLVKTHSIVYLSELENLPHNRIVNHNGQFYYASADINTSLIAD